MPQEHQVHEDIPLASEDSGNRPLVVLEDDPQPMNPPPSDGSEESGPEASPQPLKRRLESVDAYRGFVMLLMATGALGIAGIVKDHGADALPYFSAGTWKTLAYQFSHAPWVGCSIWDLIQPSFMFIVGVAMPFSFAKRTASGQSRLKCGAHVAWRAIVLILLGVFLSSNSSNHTQTNFTFVNVLTQIGLGYVFVYMLLGRRVRVQLLAATTILVGYWLFFYQMEPQAAERQDVTTYLKETRPNKNSPPDEAADLGSFPNHRLASAWNKHHNAAASADRELLDALPSQKDPWRGSSFWINRGGYQTLNFIPSIATMIFGVLAGQLLLSGRRWKTLILLTAGLVCFVIAMALDTNIWPVKIAGCDWSLCPTVKRIWTPTWAIFSTGWTLWLLAAFHCVIDVAGIRFWAFPLKVVGMNSIVMYCMAQLIKPWSGATLERHLNTVDPAIWYETFGKGNVFGPFWTSLAVLSVLWLICLWLYRKRIFVRI